MSRRPAKEANEPVRPEGPTRRFVLGAGTLPLLASQQPGAASDDEAAAACEKWLANEAEQEQLIRRWQQIETQVYRTLNWAKLSPEERERYPEYQEMDRLNERIVDLSDANAVLLSSLPTSVATSSRGVGRKLAVAMICVCPDENEEAHLLIGSILRDYLALHGE